jgi:nitrate/nitrite-specific signal transduction histidine kinase
MLRRKLLTRIGLLIAAFVCGAVVAIWLLQDALSEIDRTNRDAAVLIDGIQNVGGAVTRIQAAREAAGDGAPDITAAAKVLDESLKQIGTHHAARPPNGRAAAAFERTAALLPEFLRLNTDPGTMHTSAALASSVEVQSAVQDLGTALRIHVAAEQASLGRYFRSLVLGLTLAALLMVNVAIIVLLRTAQVVLKPVAALVEGSRELATEHFEHRVHVDQQDEFAELAHAYNRLAGQLQANEERKTETLRQLAVTLNHDLNNAMAVIELQLGLLDRQAGTNPTLARHLTDIRTNLGRMSGTVASLKNIRRVVLTEYGPGQKMVDLERSTAPAESAA